MHMEDIIKITFCCWVSLKCENYSSVYCYFYGAVDNKIDKAIIQTLQCIFLLVIPANILVWISLSKIDKKGVKCIILNLEKTESFV